MILRNSKYLGLGFLVQKSISVTETCQVDDRIAYITVRKKNNYASKITQDGIKIYRTAKKTADLVLINVHAPHMGCTLKNMETTEEFYKKLNSVVREMKGKDLIILGDFNAKIGKNAGISHCMGAHSRGIMNTNGEFLLEFMTNNNLLASNTYFKHRACHITTYEQKTAKYTIYNQIDYIILRQNRKQAMINARSHINHRIDSDHRLVTTSIWKKMDFERNVKRPPRIAEQDPIISKLSQEQKQLREKIFQSTNSNHILAWKKEPELYSREKSKSDKQS